ncbi:glycine--tRNA ligase subunit beta [Pseudoteredinibacter isoporae]|uniref:Glycine--tRNA ligase beta subunit n=1 Tax=Pseudoteredinibacter isoporae TaxID=570281 RepID=A0A7X0MWT9_9GAMM|nr:glycine--tRNA ligase subunit beta [Pseudoteredinibacter isoporae]MBB6520172.1 glycyl-tRNA synthetase beta chain [Pseudoteredinibacter isoporae]NHO85744.1 glycine--tRNA ligase subunit beta [Pseudoteredinibacter isoporae]NIB25804.1 glycine--tRNA ligase subunit beta [Pseudoteredinibacter isoporae]
MKKDFLVELGTEELPPKALKTLSNAFQQGIETGLKDLELSFDSVKAYAAPRRLAVQVNGLDEQTPVKEVAVWGPPAKIAFDGEGKPSKAAEAFANKNGIAVDDLKTENDGKQDKLIYRKKAGGELTSDKLEAIIQTSLAKLPIAKRMRWGARRDEFVRPVQWLMMLFGNELIEAEVYGVKANRETRGHRFHYNQTLIIDQASEYAEKLQSIAYVMADFEQRRELIKQQVLAEATKVNGEAMLDEELLDEVTALVEWPVALTGKFEESFLEVPSEALVYSMKEHQKYFPVQNTDGQLMPYFITISNIESKDPAQVISGNEKVIRPRLADAAFFFETDKKTSLSDMRERLKPIVFQAQLGSIYDKTERIRNLAQMMVQQVGGDLAKCQRAAELCKSDLVSDMVGEFDKMQGVAGYYYAKHAGEDEEVALALQEQYLPKFAGDKLPSSTTGTIIALADRLDTLSGIFGIGQKPTGSKDPFALRRASVAVLRLLVEKELPLDLGQLLKLATINHGSAIKDSEASVKTALDYMLERFRAWYEEEKIAAEVFMAVSAKNLSVPLDINRRVHAVHAFSQLEDATALAAANKRVSNILAKLESPVADDVNDALLTEAAEKALAKAVAEKAEQVAPLFVDANYTEALSALADLRPVVDSFFDDVMVMADDMDLRNNRLALLNKLRQLFLQVADISLLAPAK